MATFDVLFPATSVGVNRAWDRLDTSFRPDGKGGYPAYDILRTDEDAYRISLAVPGFTGEEIAVELRDGALWIKAERAVEADHNRYLYRGIDLHGFQQSFALPEHVKVQDAHLRDGMLHIDLARELPEALRPRRIEVRSAGGAALEDASKAA